MKIIQSTSKMALLRRVILLAAFVVLLLPADSVSQGSNNDMMVYAVINNRDDITTLMLYDPQNGESTPVFTAAQLHDFSLSADRRLAVSAGSENDGEIYVIDAQSPDSVPISITTNSPAPIYRLAWNPDGRYLAFRSSPEGESSRLYVWNGETAIDITPGDLESVVRSYSLSWSSDGRLAFTVRYPDSDDGDASEIYLWDGHKTARLSQNRTGDDEAPDWSPDGRLAFLSERNDDYDIFIWDGTSFKNGLPDAATFINVTPELTGYYSFPQWTNQGFLTFTTTGPQDRYAQIYLWDGQTLTNISQNPTLHNGSQSWNTDGQWAFATFFSSQQLLYVRDTDNRTIFTAEGYAPAWSSSGYLMYCTEHPDGWGLSIWDGQQIIDVAQGREILARWSSGSGVTCSSG